MQPAIEDEFRDAMRRLAASVNIVTCYSRGLRYGMTATAVTSLCADPPALLVCVNRTNIFHAALRNASSFCVNILGTQHRDVSAAFGRKTVHPTEKFAVGRWATNPTGLPYLTDSQSNLFCTVASVFSYGTHDIFIGTCDSIVNADASAPVAPLLYANGRYASVAELPS
ncbi:flavin reductase family protein [Paraburkholderia strydomiana]|jgi:flavin reductase (DIM6/NTAB) family NADH-FMN oxidoreductase RutF|uniref:flavin reductase family protein n=1 Tax=Paraburkholderia TaxID=1822464 RepID=UPI0038BA089A